MKKVFFIAVVSTCLIMLNANAQNVGINTPNPTYSLDINGGLRLRPQTTAVTGTTVQLISNRAHHVLSGSPTDNFNITFIGATESGQHLIITNATLFNGFLLPVTIPAGVTAELMYSNGNWKLIGSSEATTNTAWGLKGNTDTDTSINFIGTTDNKPLAFRLNNIPSGILSADNVALGLRSLSSAKSSRYNTAMGAYTLYFDTSGQLNTAMGFAALSYNINGSKNTAIGAQALQTNSFGNDNTAIGYQALGFNGSSSDNTAIGSNAMRYRYNGFGNTSIGSASMFQNSGNNNVSIGTASFWSDTTGSRNVSIGAFALADSRNSNGAVAIGSVALYSDTAANGIVAIGRAALYNSNGRRGNLAIGDSALYSNSLGSNPLIPLEAVENVAVGNKALLKNTIGRFNTSVGFAALENNTIGRENVAVGNRALNKNQLGENNVAIGTNALRNNTDKSDLVAIGKDALLNNGLGATLPWHSIANTAIGSEAMYSNTTGRYNTAIGFTSLWNNNTGEMNTSIGTFALATNQSGISNTAIGHQSLYKNFGDRNTAIGKDALNSILTTTGSGNVAIGNSAGFNELTSNKLYIENTDANKDAALIYGDFAADSLLLNAKTINKFSLNVRGSNALEMGYGAAGKQTDAGKICYGCFGDPANWLGIVGGGTAALGTDRVIKLWSEGGLRIRGNALPDFNNTYSLGTSGQRWSEVWTNAAAINTSDARLKTNIVVSPYGLKEVLQMYPVQYNWKTNPNNDLQIGFLAQDIQKLVPEAVVVPANGDPLGMKYTELIPVLVKAIQEQQKKIDELEKMVKALQK